MNRSALSLFGSTSLSLLVAASVAQAQTQLWSDSANRAAIMPNQFSACVAGQGFVSSGGNCTPTPPTLGTSYWRLFDRSNIQPLVGGLSVTGAFDIIQVNFGVECANSAAGFIDLRINVFSAQSSASYLGREILDYRDVTIPNSGPGVLDIPICPPIFVPQDVSFLAIEILPAPAPVPQRFFIGGNTAPTTFPGAIRAPMCGLSEPANMPPNMILEFVSSQPVGRASWTQSEDSVTVQASSAVCTAPLNGQATDNSFWRIYDRFDPIPPDSGCFPLPPTGCPVPPGPVCVSGGLEILSVTTGIGLSLNGGSRDVTINFYEDPDGGAPGPLSSLVRLGGETFTLGDVPIPTGLTVAFANPIYVPKGVRWIAVEVMIEQGGFFNIGANGNGESPANSSYISAPDCGLNEPVPFASFGFPNDHMILNFESRPMAVKEQCIVPAGPAFRYPFEQCGFRLPDPLVVELFMPGPGNVPYSPPRGLEVDIVIRGIDNVVETPFGGSPTFPMGGTRSTFDCVLDLHFIGTGGLAGLLDRKMTLRPSLGGTIARGLMTPTPGGTLTFGTEIEDITVEITAADMDRDFVTLKLQLGTNNFDPTGLPLSSSGEVHLVEPPCTGTFVVGEFGSNGLGNQGEGMGHSALQGAQWPTIVTDVHIQIDPPSEDPSALTLCSSALNPNSTNVGGKLGAVGSGNTDIATGRDLRITQEDLPAGQPRYFLVSSALGFIPNPAGSNGNFCLGAEGVFPGRYNCSPCGQVGFDDSFFLDVWAQNLATTVDPGGQNMPPDPVQVPLPGETYYWQCWHRDVGNTSNFTDVVGVTFY